MAIEHNAGYDESPDTEMPTDDSQGETVDIPISMVMDGQPGDVVRLEIVSRDEGSGTAKVKYATDDKETPGGIKEAAAAFEA